MNGQMLIDAYTLLEGLKTAKKAYRKNNALPILETFKAEVKAQKGKRTTLTLSTTDLENSISVTMPCEGITSFEFLLPVSELKFIEKVESEIVTFKAYEIEVIQDAETGRKCTHYYIDVTAGADFVTLEVENPLDFPKMPQFADGKQLLAWVNGDFQTELKTLAKYTSEDDLRPAMCGVFFQTRETGYHLCATDAHRLRTAELPGEMLYNGTLSDGYVIEAILPTKFCEIVSSFKNINETLLAIQDRNFFALFTDGIYTVETVTRSIDARYPDYNRVIPTQNPISVKADVKPLLKAIDKGLLFANKTTKQGIFSINGDIKLTALDIDFGRKYTGSINHLGHAGPDIDIAFNLSFLQEALKLNDTAGVMELELSSPTRAGVLKNKNGITLIMPVCIEQD